jgi:hypothetical protein
MNAREVVIAAVDALIASKADYLTVGAFASNLYSIPRSTYDVDFLLRGDADLVKLIVGHLGPGFHLNGKSASESVCHSICAAGTPFTIELFLAGSDAHDDESFSRRQRIIVAEREVFVPTAEDVLITKLRWYREKGRSKDFEDARGIVAVQAERLDFGHVQRWCEVHGTRELLDQIRVSLPPI